MADEFYLLDSRTVVGNCALWWCPDGKGYTCELDKAGLYSRDEAVRHRETDVPVPRALVEALAIRHIRLDWLRDQFDVRGYEKTTSREQREAWLTAQANVYCKPESAAPPYQAVAQNAPGCPKCGCANFVIRKRCRECGDDLVMHPDPEIDAEVRWDAEDGARSVRSNARDSKPACVETVTLRSNVVGSVTIELDGTGWRREQHGDTCCGWQITAFERGAGPGVSGGASAATSRDAALFDAGYMLGRSNVPDSQSDRWTRLEAGAKALPLGLAFHGGPLHDAPRYDVAMVAVRYARGEPSPLDHIAKWSAGDEHSRDPFDPTWTKAPQRLAAQPAREPGPPRDESAVREAVSHLLLARVFHHTDNECDHHVAAALRWLNGILDAPTQAREPARTPLRGLADLKRVYDEHPPEMQGAPRIRDAMQALFDCYRWESEPAPVSSPAPCSTCGGPDDHHGWCPDTPPACEPPDDLPRTAPPLTHERFDELHAIAERNSRAPRTAPEDDSSHILWNGVAAKEPAPQAAPPTTSQCHICGAPVTRAGTQCTRTCPADARWYPGIAPAPARVEPSLPAGRPSSMKEAAAMDVAMIRAQVEREIADAIERDHRPGTYPYEMAQYIRTGAYRARTEREG